jgi:L-lactate dehydrogenase complex protein LldE
LRIALFITCLTDTLYPDTGKAIVTILRRLGHEVEFPLGQSCCGQMHFNTGYRREALPMARNFAATFAPYDAIVTPSASCASMVHEYYPALAAESDDRQFGAALAGLIPKVYEFSAFLADVLKVTPDDLNAYFPHKVTYHPTCHGLRMLKLGDAPYRLLAGVRGLRLIELPDAESCCGFGGTFAVKNADTSAAICADKVSAIRQTQAEVVTATDNSCLMHIGGALSRQRTGVRTMHLAEILASTE